MLRALADFLIALNREGARYVVVGGMAVLSHVPYRLSRNLDVLIEPTLANAERVRRAVSRWLGQELHLPLEAFLSGEALAFGAVVRVQVHSLVHGASWDGVWARRQPGHLLDVPTHYASLLDLIAMKECASRSPHDAEDLRRLRRVAEQRRLAAADDGADEFDIVMSD